MSTVDGDKKLANEQCEAYTTLSRTMKHIHRRRMGNEPHPVSIYASLLRILAHTSNVM